MYFVSPLNSLPALTTNLFKTYIFICKLWQHICTSIFLLYQGWKQKMLFLYFIHIHICCKRQVISFTKFRTLHFLQPLSNWKHRYTYISPKVSRAVGRYHMTPPYFLLRSSTQSPGLLYCKKILGSREWGVDLSIQIFNSYKIK